jgi:hypothetical protein
MARQHFKIVTLPSEIKAALARKPAEKNQGSREDIKDFL